MRLVTIALAVSLGIASPLSLAGAVTVLVDPPEPRALAALLYGTNSGAANRHGAKYRSATSSAPGRIGMMIHFEFDSTKIVPESLPMLDSVGEMLGLGETAKEVLVIVGHADARGSPRYNQRLSERRARAIKEYLIGTFDVNADRLIPLGEGESRPHDANDPYAGINRRVEFRSNASIVVN